MISHRPAARRVRARGAAAIAVIACVAGCSGTSSGTDPSSRTADGTTSSASAADASPSGTTTWPQGSVAAPIGRFACPPPTVRVSTSDQLIKALARARAGDVIQLADGTYVGGGFVATSSGTRSTPIWLCGGRGAALQGRSVDNGYGLHLDHASHWRVAGFTVRRAQKGVVVDGGTDDGLQDLVVENTGDEAVHLRRNSTGNVVRGLTISRTGLLEPTFGEGVYVGTAKSNWGTVTGGQPDRSDDNYLIDNAISSTTAEAIDIKEGTSRGFIVGDRFDGSGMTAATAWVNVKGNGWTVTDNRGVNTPKDGFQVHVVLDGWGDGNVFAGNTADLTDAPGEGVGIYVQKALGNRVECSNVTVGGRPRSNVACTG